jgi:DNA-binding CsgD family transcriptional regulator
MEGLDRTQELERARVCFAGSAWAEAFERFETADRAAPLEADDLELLGTSAYMLGAFDEFVQALERAYRRHSENAEALRAVRCAFWIGMNLALRGDVGPATGWLGRAQRLVERHGHECVEEGYLLLPVVFEHDAAGDYEGAAATAATAAEIGERFGDADLVALAVHSEGEILLKDGRVREGLGLLDEAMVAVTAGELSPVVTGIVYCGVILACERVYELRRAQEWTAALTRWCAEQPDLVAFTGRCRVHRAELMRVHGAWADALDEARRTWERPAEVMANEAAAARASYLLGDLHRLRGEFAQAERAYREASRLGDEPQPGLALLRLGQGKPAAAEAAIRRAVNEAGDRPRRATLLAAAVEIMLASGDVEGARHAARGLREIAAAYESAMLRAMSAQADGAVELAAGEAGAALPRLRSAWQGWQDVEAPYDAARTRVLLALACKALGDADAFGLELDAARAAFDALGAAPDAARVDALAGARHDGGLSRRELEVLRLVASGKTNREIAASLVISEHTVARHLQNIFTKLGVTTRTAAGAYAFEHDLL